MLLCFLWTHTDASAVIKVAFSFFKQLISLSVTKQSKQNTEFLPTILSFLNHGLQGRQHLPGQ